MTRRWPLLAALAYALFGVIGLFLLPTAPDVDATGQELVAHLDEHSGAIRVVIWLVTLALLAFVPLAAAIREHLVGIGRDVTLIGATSVAILTTVWTWTNAGLALHADTLDPGVARTFTDVAAYYGPTLTAMVILFAAPVGWAAWHRQGGLPRWLAWVTLVLVVEQLIETTTTLATSGFLAPGGPMNLEVGAGLFLLWVVAAGAAVSPRTPPPSTQSE